MKGTIVKCLEGLVKSKSTAEAWKAVVIGAGLPSHSIFTTTAAVPDGDVLKLIGATAEHMKMSVQGAIDAFGEYWSTTYAPGIYGVYFEKAKGAKAFLLSLDNIHVLMTKSMAGAAPPRFTYEDTGPKQLVMHYSSPRGMVNMMPALIQGVAKFYREKATVHTVGNALHITFA